MAHEITAELQGVPDFIIGNYSDGNLVASLLAYKMGVTQVSYTDFSLLIKSDIPDDHGYVVLNESLNFFTCSVQ